MEEQIHTLDFEKKFLEEGNLDFLERAHWMMSRTGPFEITESHIYGDRISFTYREKYSISSLVGKTEQEALDYLAQQNLEHRAFADEEDCELLAGKDRRVNLIVKDGRVMEVHVG